MLKNYLTIAFRNLIKYRSYTLINLVGLAGSAAVSILILFYALQVLTFDQHHEDADSIYFLFRDRPSSEGPIPVYDTWYPLSDAMVETFPEVENRVRFFDNGVWASLGDNSFEEEITYTDPEILEVFSFPLAKGDIERALDDPYSLIISQEVAARYFGEGNPMGKTLTLNFEHEYTVTGVLAEQPANSSFDFSLVAPFRENLPIMEYANWEASFLSSFVKIPAGTDLADLSKKFPAFVDTHIQETERGNLRLLPLKDLNNEFTQRRGYAYILVIVALGILLIAAINFTNLSTAHSLLRTKEVGVRKVLGATRRRLIGQFLMEALITAYLALGIGLVLTDVLQPYFNEMVDMQLRMDIWTYPWLLPGLLGLGLLIGLLSGSYPAFFLSGQDPVTVFKGKAGARNKGQWVRNSLVTVQFGIAMIFISGMLVILSQLDYMKNRDLQFDQEHVVVIPVSQNDFADREEGTEKVSVLKNELLGLSGVEAVSASSSVPGRYSGSFSLFLAEGQEDRDPFDWRFAQVEDNYFSTYQIELLSGREFRKGSEADMAESVILNESAVRIIGWEDPIGKKLKSAGSDRSYTVVGVTRDFNYQGLQQPVRPVVHFYDGDAHTRYRYLSVRLSEGGSQQSLDRIQERLADLGSMGEVNYFFPEERFARLYQTEENMAQIISATSVLAILIASLGLYALASFVILQRSKEFAIRKVLGAQALGLASLFVKRFAWMILIAFVLASPLAYLLAENWLADFAFRMELELTPFILTGLFTLALAILTISIHTWRAVRMNPVIALRDE